jgi:hypothetical protein
MADPIKIALMATSIGIVYVIPGQAGIGAAFVFYLIANAVWTRLGGWPEGWYRITGTDYLQDYIIGPTGKVERPFIRMKDLETHSPAKFTHKAQGAQKEGDYFLGDNYCRIANPKNAPAYIHTFDDSRAIPVWNRDLPRMDAALVHAGYKNDVLERMHKLNVPQQRLKWGILGFFIVVTFVLSFAALYYTILYGVNVNCALHTKACI